MPKGFMPSRVREMAIDERAWIGAMIEAEGSVAIQPKHSAHRVKLNVVNTDLEIISAMFRSTGAGSVQLKSINPIGGAGFIGSRPCWVWWCSRWNEIKDLVRQCGAYSMKLQKVAAFYKLEVQ